jgi:ankyrin repeat protein
MDNLQEIYLSDKLISWRDFVDTVGRLTKKPRVQRLLLRSKVSGSNTILWHTFKDAEAIKAVLALPTFTVDEILVPNSILLSTTTFKGTVEAIINYIHQKGELRRAEEWFCRFHPRRRSLLHELIGTPGFKLKHLKHVLSLGLDPNIVDIDGKCALARAVFQAEVDKVAMLLQHNANPNVAYSIGHFAVTNPIETFLALLVKHGMKLGIKSPLGNTLLHSAAQPILHIPTAWFLKWLTPDIDVNAQNYLGETALITAIKNGRHELAVELFRIGVDPRVSAKDGTTALHCAIGSKFDEDPTQSPLRETLLELLLSVPGIPLNNPTTKTPLCRAIAEQDVALVKRLLELGADPTIPHQKLGNALQYALKFSLFSSVALEIIEALLSTPYQEALLSTSTRDHPSVLCSAAAGLCFPFLKHFTPRFKDKLNDRSDINGLTVILFTLSRAIVVNLLPLMFPSSRHSALMFGKQVRDFDSRLSENQRRPFSVVVQSRVAQAIRSFVAHGADIYIKDNNGFSVAHYAALGGYIPVLQYLMELGLDLNIANYGVTPLHLAYLGNMTRTVRWLIDIGQVNQDAVDFRGMKPVQYGFIFARLHTPDYQNPDWEGDEDDEEEAY